jgi:phospholipid transport system substrate-binding protein
MQFPNTEPAGDGPETSPYRVANGVAPGAPIGLPRGVSEALADPIVKALMAADHVAPKDIEELLRRTAGRLALHDQPRTSPRVAAPELAVKHLVSTALARFARVVTLALALTAGVSAAPPSAAADEAPVAFIRALGDQALSVARSDMLPVSKAAYFDRMLQQDFDLTDICRFVLGPYWRLATPYERQEFSGLFTDRLINFYGRRLAQSGDADFVVTGSRTEPGGVVVTSRIIPRQGNPIVVDWRLGVSNGLYKIEDVAIDGVSMTLAQRSEIAALIARQGGQVEMLLTAMRVGY